MTYQGYANYATWLIDLHARNDQGWYDEWKEMVNDVLDYSKATDWVSTYGEACRYNLAVDLKQWTLDFLWAEDTPQELGDDLRGVFIKDVLSAFVEDVDWNEIAVHWLEAE